MSDHWIIFIPDDPDFVPPDPAQQESIALLKSLAPRADEVKAETSDQVRFINCGGNFERIVCPGCSRDIDMEWWTERMAEDSQLGFRLRPFKMPCCSAQKRLNELTYELPQGFARFSLEAMNPNMGVVPEDKVKELEQILGCSLITIFRHL